MCNICIECGYTYSYVPEKCTVCFGKVVTREERNAFFNRTGLDIYEEVKGRNKEMKNKPTGQLEKLAEVVSELTPQGVATDLATMPLEEVRKLAEELNPYYKTMVVAIGVREMVEEGRE